jgi:hypothetical protein
MHWLPTRCEACQRVDLLPARDGVEGKLPCPACGGIAHVVPGCSYAEGDVALFTELARVVSSGKVSLPEALRLTIDIERAAATGKEAEAFMAVARRLPLLEPMRLMLEAHPKRLRQALLMFATVLNALTLMRGSGTLAAVAMTEAEELRRR